MSSMDRLAGDSGGPARTDWTTVSADLDRVLGPVAAVPDPSVPATPQEGTGTRRRARWPLAVLLVMLLAGGIAAAAMYAWYPLSAARPASGIGLEVPPARGSDPLALRPAKALLAIAAPPRTAPVVRIAAHYTTPRAVAASEEATPGRAASRVAAVRPVMVSSPSTSPAVGCTDLAGDDLARCLQPRLEVADHRLVDAYAAAAAAGVSRPLLVAVRDRWVDARDATRDDPRDTLRRYAELADDLRGMAAQRRGAPGANAE